MYKISEIDRIKRIVEYYDLEVPSGFYALSLRKLQKICNGCGPEVWSEVKRKALTAALKRYEAAFLVHDVCYEIMEDRAEADAMLKRNMVKILKRDFGFFWWLSRRGRAERFVIIPAVYIAVVFGGEDAYTEAQKGDE